MPKSSTHAPNTVRATTERHLPDSLSAQRTRTIGPGHAITSLQHLFLVAAFRSLEVLLSQMTYGLLFEGGLYILLSTLPVNPGNRGKPKKTLNFRACGRITDEVGHFHFKSPKSHRRNHQFQTYNPRIRIRKRAFRCFERPAVIQFSSIGFCRDLYSAAASSELVGSSPTSSSTGISTGTSSGTSAGASKAANSCAAASRWSKIS